MEKVKFSSLSESTPNPFFFLQRKYSRKSTNFSQIYVSVKAHSRIACSQSEPLVDGRCTRCRATLWSRFAKKVALRQSLEQVLLSIRNGKLPEKKPGERKNPQELSIKVPEEKSLKIQKIRICRGKSVKGQTSSGSRCASSKLKEVAAKLMFAGQA